MKEKSFNVALIILSIFLIFSSGCEKEEIDNDPCQLDTCIIYLQLEDTSTYVSDVDGNIYKTVQIGDQFWMAENLMYDANNNSWVYNNNNAVYLEAYGRLYNWEAANEVCPDGWHLPSDSDWNELINYLGGSSVAGGKMKETGTLHWHSPNAGATDISGFSALAGGFRNTISGYYLNLDHNASFWSSSEVGSEEASYIGLGYSTESINENSFLKSGGFSVRCVQNDKKK